LSGILVLPCVAQLTGVVQSSGTFQPATGANITRSMTLEPGMMMHMGPPVTGQPYSGDLESERTQTLNNGTHIHQKKEVSRTYRDSQGRMRTERMLFRPLRPTEAKEEAPRLIQIYDPIEGYEYTLDTRKHIAHRVAVPTIAQNPTRQLQRNQAALNGSPALSPVRRLANGPLQDAKREPLGTQTIEGEEAEGTRTTITTPVDAIGNDKPIVRVCETWHAVELKTLMLSKCSDPRFGRTTLRLTNIDRSEPDPTLFMVPSDYTIVDNKRTFTVGFKEP
jgi:hypothetical protein